MSFQPVEPGMWLNESAPVFQPRSQAPPSGQDPGKPARKWTDPGNEVAQFSSNRARPFRSSEAPTYAFCIRKVSKRYFLYNQSAKTFIFI